MTTPAPSPPVTPPPTERVPLRLDLALGGDAVDGSWWPQSRDLQRELADLVDVFPPELGRVDRVVFSRPDWDTAPHHVRVARGPIKVGSYPHDDSHQVWLVMSTKRIIRLAVWPAETAYAEHAIDPEDQWSDFGGAWWDPHPLAPSERL